MKKSSRSNSRVIIRTTFSKRPLFDHENEDLMLADALLCGYVEGKVDPAIPQIKFLEDEREAREALCRLLRSKEPLDRALRLALAELFDPVAGRGLSNLDSAERGDERCGMIFAMNMANRTLKFGFRSKRRRRDELRDYSIAYRVHDNLRESRNSGGSDSSGRKPSVDDAILKTAEQLGISYETIRRIWRNHKKQFGEPRNGKSQPQGDR